MKTMADAYVIEIQGSTVGIIVRQDGNPHSYRFLASLDQFNDLEGKEFAGPLQAEIAARSMLNKPRRQHIQEGSRFS
jgi:hypothetical protein